MIVSDDIQFSPPEDAASGLTSAPRDPDTTRHDPDGTEPGVTVIRGPRRLIIVEPVLALFFTASLPSSTLISQFVYALVSVKNNLTQVLNDYGEVNGTLECVDDVTDYADIYELQQYVQTRSADLLVILNICSNIPAMVMVLLYGAYSDRIGRKLPMILPLVGQLVKCIIYMVTIRYRLSLYLLVAGNILEGLSGGMPTMGMSCFSYLANTCDNTKRTVRITAIEVTCGLCSAVGQVAMGLAISYLGYMWPFLFVLTIHLINLIYVVGFVPDQRRKSVQEDQPVFGAQVTRGLKLYTSDDASGQAWQRWLLLAAMLCCDTVVVGRWDPLTLFCMNSPLCWSSVIIGGYVAWTALCSQFGGIGLVAALHKKLHDTGLVMLGCISGCVYFTLLAFCNSTWSMFTVAPVGLASFLPVAMLRAINSKVTAPDQQGAMFSVLAVVDTLCSLTGSVIFTPIYGATLMFMKGFVFIVMAILQCVGLGLIVIYWFKSDKQHKTPADEPNNISGYESIN